MLWVGVVSIGGPLDGDGPDHAAGLQVPAAKCSPGAEDMAQASRLLAPARPRRGDSQSAGFGVLSGIPTGHRRGHWPAPALVATQD